MEIVNDILNLIRGWLEIDESEKIFLIELGQKLGAFFIFICVSMLVGRFTPNFIHLIIKQFSSRRQLAKISQNLIEPLEDLFKLTGTLIFINLFLPLLERFQEIYDLLEFFIDLAVIVSLAYLTSRLFQQFIRVYGIDLVGKFGRGVNELLLVIETIANLIIGFIAVLAIAQILQFNLLGLLAGAGLGGLAIVFAAQKTLEQILGTVVLYLDRTFIAGEYIRIHFSRHVLFGRVESIGLRSTKVRTAAKGTLVIIPNSTLANIEIENITRGKKLMVLLYLDFVKVLEATEQALIEQVVKESTNSLFGIDPGSTKITLFQPEDQPGTRARVTFFILGSSENSLQLRKRLLEIANQKISKQLSNVGITFTMQEPTIYVESPVTI